MNTAIAVAERFFSRLNQRQVLAVVVLMLTTLGLLDYLTGFEASFSFFYLLPVALGTWYFGLRAGRFLVLVSVAVWVFSNWLAGEAFSSEAIRLWNAFLRLLFFSLIVQVVERYQQALFAMTRLSRTDALTGVYNSREFFRLAEQELLHAQRYRRPVTLAYIDLDNFKVVNDRLGHAAGDQLLRTITDLISSQLRRTDIFARMGGDEFALLLPETDLQAAESVIMRMREKLSVEMQVYNAPTSFSLGAVAFINPPPSVEAMLREADALMYAVKQQGKNSFRVISQ